MCERASRERSSRHTHHRVWLESEAQTCLNLSGDLRYLPLDLSQPRVPLAAAFMETSYTHLRLRPSGPERILHFLHHQQTQLNRKTSCVLDCFLPHPLLQRGQLL